MFGKKWYIEVLIVLLTDILITPVIIFVPFPLSSVLSYSLVVIVLLIWRVYKKELTIKEVITLVSIYFAISITTSMFIPIPLSTVVAISLTFLTIWLIHKKTSTIMDQSLKK
jgi:hypothetical protein